MSPNSQKRIFNIKGRNNLGETFEKDEEHFQTLFGNMLEGIQILGKDWHYLYLNTAAEKHNRRPNQELLGKKYMDMWPGIEDTHVFSVIKRCMEEQVASQLDNRFVFPDGTDGWFTLSIQPVPEGVLILSFDVTERVRAEKQTAQMKRLYATLSQVNQTIIRVKEPDELYKSICDVAVQFGEFSLAWIGLLDNVSGEVRLVAASGVDIKQWPFPLVNVNEGPLKDGLIARAIRNSTVETSEDLQSEAQIHTLHDKFQDLGYRSSAVVPFHLRNKTIGALCLVSQREGLFQAEDEIHLLDEMGLDISFALKTMENEVERKQTETALRESETRFRSLIENSSDEVSILDADGKLLYESPTSNPTLGYQLGEFLGANLFQLIHPDDLQQVQSQFIQLVQDPNLHPRQQFRLKHKDGNWRWVEAVGTNLLSEPSVSGIVINYHDITKRKQAEEEVRKSEERFRSLYENATIGLYRTTPDGQILLANPTLVNMLGYSSFEELAQRNLEQEGYDIGYKRSKFRQQIEANGKVTGLESIWTRKDGTSIFVRESAKVIRDTDNRIAYYEGTVEDISDRKRAEMALVENEKRFRALIEHAPDGIVINGSSGHIEYASPATSRIMGYSIDEILAADPAQLTHPDDLPLLLSQLDEILQSPGKTITAQYRMRHKDGSWRWLESNISNSSDLPDIGGLVFNFRDITERKQANEALLESEQRFRRLFATSPDAILLIDPHNPDISWPIVDCNEAACRMNGYTREELIGQSVNILNRTEGTQEERTTYLNNLRHKGVVFMETFHRHKDGHLLPIEVSTSLINFEGQELIMGIDRDITERKLAEQALQKSEKRYRTLFEDSPLSIWEEDFSRVKEYLDTLKQTGITDFRTYFADHPEVVSECVGMIEILDANNAALQMYHANNKEELIEGTLQMMSKGELEHIQEDFVAVAEGKTGYSWDGIDETFTGEPIEISLSWSVAPGHEHDYSKVIVTTIDITERKRVEKEIRHRTEDLTLINALNEAANRGENIEGIIEVFAREARNMLDCYDIAIYLLSPDRKHIELQNHTLSHTIIEKIEMLIGRPIPRIRIPIRENSHFKKMIDDEMGTIINDPTVLQQWIEEFADTTFLPKIMRLAVRKVAPQIFKILNIGSAISVPLLSSGQAIGILGISSPGQLTEDDLQRIRHISHQMTAVILRKQVEKERRIQIQRLSALSKIDRAIASSLDMRLSLDILLGEVLSQLEVDAAAVLLLNHSNLTLDFVAGKGFRTLDIRHSHVHLGEGFAGQVGLKHKALHIPILLEAEDEFTRSELLKRENFIGYFGIPLIAKGVLKGVLEVFQRTPLDPDIEWINYLETLGRQATIAIDNAQLFENLQKSNLELFAAYDATIEGWSQAMELRDKETEGHAQRVTDLTMDLARKMGISPEEQVHIRRGALLHDIGKLGVPDQILLKPGKLTEDEWVIMRQHPTYAYEMFSSIRYLQPALDIPYCHHEKWDGSGYPRGLEGEQIPLAARIFAIVDVWDALTSDRPYRPAWTKEKTLEYIQEQSGHHFDPQVVAAFLETIKFA